MNPLFLTAWFLVVAMFVLVAVNGIQQIGSPEECRRIVLHDFRQGEIGSLDELDAELQSCGR